jgi:6-phosphogluconolactonase/glucosamine-6-phosphate isomerase/deaminase
VLPVARLVLVMTSGERKADVVAQVMGDDRDVGRWPAQATLLPNAVWVIDRPAAAKLSSDRQG